jgi:hypothetical protein
MAERTMAKLQKEVDRLEGNVTEFKIQKETNFFKHLIFDVHVF